MNEANCSNCGKLLGSEFCGSSEDRLPCPDCGSTARTWNLVIREQVNLQVHMKLHSKHREGTRKVVREEYAGDDLHRKTGKWNLLRRLIDRKNNRYEETITDGATGERLRDVAEPLTEHRNSKTSK